MFKSLTNACLFGYDVHNLQRPTQQKSGKGTKVPEPLRKTKYAVSVVSLKWGAAGAISQEENLVHTARSYFLHLGVHIFYTFRAQGFIFYFQGPYFLHLQLRGSTYE